MLNEPSVTEHRHSMPTLSTMPPTLPAPRTETASFGNDPSMSVLPRHLPATAAYAPLPPHMHQQPTQPSMSQYVSSASAAAPAAVPAAAPAAAGERDMTTELLGKVLQQMEMLNRTVSLMDRRLQLVEDRMTYIEGAEPHE